jgi:hypothetical protein
MNTREKLRAAASAPKVPYWSGLVAGLVMAGAKIVPEDLWTELGEWANQAIEDELVEDFEELMLPGFKQHSNHARTESHETWQEDLVHELILASIDTNPGKTVWVIPISELSCLAADDEDYRDLTSILRFTFVGTEDELRAAVRQALV